jgi:serine protease Do
MYILTQLNEGLERLAAQVRRSLVQVVTARRGRGSGVVIDPDGFVVTSAHVVRGQTKLQVVRQDGRSMWAELIGYDAVLDVAVLMVPSLDLHALPLGRPGWLKSGDWVMAIGYPWGVAGAATVGVVSRVGDEWHEHSLRGRRWITADVHLRPGHSGGPLVNADGEVVGINTMILGPDLGVAVPIDDARDLIETAKAGVKV